MLNRQNSATSILSSNSDFCRICHCDSSCGELISPCYCSGSLRWVHQICLQHWIRASNSKACELCRYPFSMKTKLKPLHEWEVLPMTRQEVRRSICSALFHIVALSCVMWSLYVLIDRTIEEFQQQELEWQFWTKIVVETIGCIGAGILVYVWGKLYVSLIRKWVAFNRTFVIINAAPAPLKQKPSNCKNSLTITTTKGDASSDSPPPYHPCQSSVVEVVHAQPPNPNCYCCAPATVTDHAAVDIDVSAPDGKTETSCTTTTNIETDNDCEAKPLLLPSSVVFTDDDDSKTQFESI